MRSWVQLWEDLELSPDRGSQAVRLSQYFRSVGPREGAWALHLLLGRKVRHRIALDELKQAVLAATGFPLWLVEECLNTGPDAAEVLALMVPGPGDSTGESPTLADCAESVPAMGGDVDGTGRRAWLIRRWELMSRPERVLFFRLVTGRRMSGFPIPVIAAALGQLAGCSTAHVQLRLAGFKEPTPQAFGRVVERPVTDPALPHPFQVLKVGAQPPDGSVNAWRLDWDWPGPRLQLIRRKRISLLWSSDEIVANARFPEIVEWAEMHLPDGVVIEGRVVQEPAAQTQIHPGQAGSGSNRAKEWVFIASDLLERDGVSLRDRPLEGRLRALRELVDQSRMITATKTWCASQLDLFDTVEQPGVRMVTAESPLRVAEEVKVQAWDHLGAAWREARALGAKGLVLRPLEGGCGEGFRWPLPFLMCEAVLLSVRRENDLPSTGVEACFGLKGASGTWVTVARVQLTSEAMGAGDLQSFIRERTRSCHGPVRMLEPVKVAKLTFEGWQESAGRRAGRILHGVRWLRWRPGTNAADLPTMEEADQRWRAEGCA